MTLSTLGAAAQVRLEGVVLDSETGTPLPGVHVVLVGTTVGAVANPEGRFALTVPGLPVDLRIRHIGYETATTSVLDPPPGDLIIELQPAVVELDEIVIAGETFAENLMRRVIRRKAEWRSAMRTYSARGFSRVVLERNGTIVHVNEATFGAFWDRERGHRSVVTRYSETAGWYDDLPLPHAADVPNLYDDFVRIQGLEFLGPTHPEALDRYAFRLGGRRMLDENIVYDLYVSPLDDRHATFVGTISVLDSAFALVGAELRPARHVVFPAPLVRWQVRYAQRFESVADSAWLPVDLQMEGTASVAIDARRRRVFDIHKRAQFSAYNVNIALPPQPFAFGERVHVETAAALNDPHFVYGRVLMPLTARETEALVRLRDEPLTLRSAVPPTEREGRLSAFLRGDPGAPRIGWPTVLGYEFRFRFNRVDGLYSSIGQTLDLGPDLQADWRLGQATALQRVRAHLRARRRVDDVGFVEAAYRRDTLPRQRHSRYSAFGSTLQTLLGGGDYFDFFWVDGGALRAGIETGGITLSASISREAHRSVERNVLRAWPFHRTFRPNPAARSGTLVSAVVSARWEPSTPTALVRRLQMHVEHAPRRLLGGDFAFTIVGLDADLRFATFLRGRPRPAFADLTITAGTAWGDAPAQRFAALDGSLRVLDAVQVARRATFRSLHGRPLEGPHHVALFWRHDFRSWPFEWGPMWLIAQRGVGMAAFGGHGRTYIPSATLEDLPFAPYYVDRFVHEAGLSLTLAGTVSLRLDAARRLDRPGFSIGIGASIDPGVR